MHPDVLHATVAVNVTDWPKFDGLRLDVRVVVVPIASVKLHVAVPEEAPVAVTEYCATNQSGRLNWSEIVPLSTPQ